MILVYIWAFGAFCMAIALSASPGGLEGLGGLICAIASMLWFIVIPASSFYLVVRISGKEWASSKRDRLERRKGAR